MRLDNYMVLLVVREVGFEPTNLSVLDPKSSASANSATLAQIKDCRRPTADSRQKTTDH
jgi:hypothetical protein